IRKLTNKRRSPANGSNTSSVGGVTSLILLTPLIAITIGSIIATEKVWATESTLSLSISNSNIAVNIAANGTSGTFVKSDASTITASTDNYTGYILKIKAASSTNYTDLVNSTDSNAKITSIESITTEGIFKGSNNTDYNGKWGYAPSQYITYSNGVGTVVDNSGTNPNFLPAPDSETGLTLDETSAPNNTSPNEYTLAIGARVDTSQKMGEYSNTYNVIMVANAISYSIVYNDGVVSNMPTDTTGTSPTTSLTLSSDTPVRSGYEFIGWCDGAVTTTNNVDSCSGTTYAAGGTYTLDGTTTNNISLTAMWEVPVATIANSTYLQDVEECPSTLTTGQVYSLKDSRDEQSYNVAKLADGKCWLLDNLALDLTSSTVLSAMNSTNTNASDTTLGYLKNGGGTTSDKYATAKVANWTSSYSYSAPLVNMGYKNTVPTDATSTAGGYKIGGYYNYCAASAGSYCYGNGTSVGTSSGNATESICPKGWRLPTGNTSGEYQALYNNSNYNTYANYRAALHLPLSGFFNGSPNNQGSYGYFWSSTRDDDYNMYRLGLDTSGIVPTDYINRFSGYSVRCVLGS
ncbi:hypothetical protein IKG64_03115, partial [Candidatus Saccharibacteria bacterium]|nr:hypothetical protein [Candidatus Saccharibacteria bacterium]